MPKPPPIDKEHEDGSWFLEAVGVKKPRPSSIESIAELEKENSVADTPTVHKNDPVAGDEDQLAADSEPAAEDEDQNQPAADNEPAAEDEAPTDDIEEQPVELPNRVVIEMTSFDGDPGTSLSTFDPVPQLPPLPSNIAYALPSPKRPTLHEPIAPAPEPPPAVGTTARAPMRWPLIAVLIAIFVIIAIVFLWLPRAADSAAATTRQSYYDASLEVRTFLPTAQASLDVVTNPSSTDAALNTVIPVVSELMTYASSLTSVAGEPLPTAPPGIPSGAIDALPPLQDRSAILASDSSEVARQIGHAYVYRTSIPQLLDAGDLPTTATPEEIAALSVTLASSLADNASLVADLPTNPAFDKVARDASDAVAGYAQWQEDYLGALSVGDAPAAQVLLNEQAALRIELVDLTSQSLLTFRDDLDTRIVSLSTEFDDHLTDLSQ